MQTRIQYEWKLETIDENEDIVDCNFSDVCPGIPTETNTRLVLVRDIWEIVGGEAFDLKDRDHAYVEDGKLTEFFHDGLNFTAHKVPKKFHIELEKTKHE